MNLFSNFIGEAELNRALAMSPAKKLFAALFLVVALYCGIDPFGHRPMAQFPDFEAYAVDMPRWRELPAARDHEDRLQRAEVKFLNQVQGPESVVFDRDGRGPYTGVADGRVVFWNGNSWADFAYTSPKGASLFSRQSLSLLLRQSQLFCWQCEGLKSVTPSPRH